MHEKLINLRAANGIEIPYVGYMRDKYYSEALESCYVYDWYTNCENHSGQKRNPLTTWYEYDRECRELALQAFGPTFTRRKENREATQKWIKAFKKSSYSEMKVFARVAGREDVCVPANSMSVGPLPDVCGV